MMMPQQPTSETMMENPPMPEPAAPAAPSTNDTIPLDALAMPDDSEQLVNPEPGDVVSYTIEGKVVSVDGNVAVIQRQTVNGKALEATPQPEDDMAGLEAMAGQLDNERI
jgi:hypothetical protein